MAEQIFLDLPCGTKMPIFGLGMWQTQNEEESRTALEAAVENGYRLIDTAYCYKNEHNLGKALGELMKSGKPKRENLFITTKLSGQHFGSRERIRKCLQSSLDNLGVSYVDLYLIHSPFSVKLNDDDEIFPLNGEGKLDCEEVDLLEVWKHMEELVDEGKIKALGLSNFNSQQIQNIYENARHPVCNLQVECHAYLAQKELFNFCKERNITMTSYASLGSPGRPEIFQDAKVKDLLSNDLVVSLAKKYGKTPAQVLLRNLIQRGIAVIPKSANPERIKQNIQVFDFNLSVEDMAAISGLDCNARCFSFSFVKGLDEHPHFPFGIPF